MNAIEERKQKSRIEDIERAAWFARLALGVADPEPLPQPTSQRSTHEYQVLA